jgi:malate synthase
MTADGRLVTRELVTAAIDEEIQEIRKQLGDSHYERRRFDDAAELFADIALADDYAEFLTIPAYSRLVEMDRVTDIREA